MNKLAQSKNCAKRTCASTKVFEKSKTEWKNNLRSFFRARTVATVYEPTYKLQPDEKPNLEVIRFVLSSVLKK